MDMGPTLLAALLCAAIGLACVALSFWISYRDKRDKRIAEARRAAREEEARAFVVRAKAAEEQRRALGVKRKGEEEKTKAKAVLGLAQDKEWDREEIMAAWRRIVKSSHPDVSDKDGRLVIERATDARNLLLER